MNTYIKREPIAVVSLCGLGSGGGDGVSEVARLAGNPADKWQSVSWL